MKTKLFFPILLLAFALPKKLTAQGCSDAGFCSISHMKPHQQENLPINSLKIGSFFGKADQSISVYGAYLEYNYQFNENFGVGTKLTTLGQQKSPISKFGLGDVFLNGNYRLNEKLKFTFGVKTPLTKGNAQENKMILPPDFQSSLGTFDFIFATSYHIEKLQLTLGVQQPLSHGDARVEHKSYRGHFIRKGDVLLRASYPIEINEKIRITPSLLPIYHLANDHLFVIEPPVGKTNTPQTIEIEGSKGLTFNSNLYLDYVFDSKNALQMSVGFPLITRKIRPDGLTRSFVANLEYKLNF
ncbi:MAG: hypothetical protein Q4A00_02595 [Flavobacteriaceae bacterium]|nr:hypothetical protein [Flavobacteriaceae bacterium]